MNRIEFSTKGWQALLAEDFTFSNVRLVTQAICNVLRRHQSYSDNFPPRLVIGYDNRLLGKKFAKAVEEIVIKNGFDAYVITSPQPTPVIISAIRQLVVTGAIIITAPHLGAEYNGIKFITARTTSPSLELTQDIEKESARLADIEIPDLPIPPGETVEFNPQEPYIKHIKEIINFKKIIDADMDITVDYMYGISRGYFNTLFGSYGEFIREIRSESHIDFKGIVPVLNKENLSYLRQIVLNPRAYLQTGLALDGDGSNLEIIDAKGTIVDHDLLFGLLINYLVINRGWEGGIVKAKKHGDFAGKVAKYHKLPVHEVKENDIYLIGEEMRLKGAIMGSDLSGGYIFKNHILERDGILAGLLVLEIIATYQQNLSLLISKLKAELK